MRYCLSILAFILVHAFGSAQTVPGARVINADSAWAGNSVNAVVFRKNSLVSFGDDQYIAFYNQVGNVVLGKRKHRSSIWQFRTTVYKGNATDAHNAISIMVDGGGYLHLAWDHHNSPLNYCRSIAPGSLELTKPLALTGNHEQQVTYPEFYKLPNGNLLFFYRDGASGNGNLVIDAYDHRTQQWMTVQQNLLNGEGQRNAYWQACTDKNGTIHISWVWRESADVASNHDMCYARSTDGGQTWQRSTGKQYILPITAASAEYICRIPQKSELINQTSMAADAAGNPYIATYWKTAGDSIPQYRVIFKNDRGWQQQQITNRRSAFSLSGVGTKSIPISRPQIIVRSDHRRVWAAVIFRDVERKNQPSIAVCDDTRMKNWTVSDLGNETVGAWEPSYDTEYWKDTGILNLYLQAVMQQDAEGYSNAKQTMVKVLEWQPKIN